MTASGKVATKQNKYRELLDQVVSFIKGPNFKAYAHKVHKAVGWKELADRLSGANDKLSSIQQKPTQQNIVEWYFEVTQINTEILTNLASAIATHTAETATHIPVIKQLSYLVDQLVIVSLDIGNFIATHLGGNKKQDLSDPDNQNQLSTIEDSVNPPDWHDKYGLHKWYTEHLERGVNEIRDTIKAIRKKHDSGTEDPEALRLSTIAASIQICIILIKMQSRIITGLLSTSAEKVGHFSNDVIKQLEIPSLVIGLGNIIKGMLQEISKAPVNCEVVLLREFDKIGHELTKVEQIGDSDTKTHTPH